jgi:hypothetical protein
MRDRQAGEEGAVFSVVVLRLPRDARSLSCPFFGFRLSKRVWRCRDRCPFFGASGLQAAAVLRRCKKIFDGPRGGCHAMPRDQGKLGD